MAALYSELAAKQVQARIQKNLGAKVGKMEYDSDEDTEEGTWEHKVSVRCQYCQVLKYCTRGSKARAQKCCVIYQSVKTICQKFLY